jgi:DNA-binding beta-propeller fold protein YncE
VTNVLPDISATQSNNATVVRIRLLTLPGIAPIPFDEDVIGSGFPARTDPNALVIGPTGVALGQDGKLYVADSLDNRVAAIPDALSREQSDGTGDTVSQGGALNDPLGMTLAPNGDVLTANGGDGNIVETTPGGMQVAVQTADALNGGGGNLFGLAVSPGTNGVYYVDDGDNTLRLLH